MFLFWGLINHRLFLFVPLVFLDLQRCEAGGARESFFRSGTPGTQMFIWVSWFLGYLQQVGLRLGFPLKQDNKGYPQQRRHTIYLGRASSV